MSGILRNVVVHQPRPIDGLFKTISRTDGKTSTPPPPEPPRPKRSPPQKCSLCGTSVFDKPQLFTQIGDLFQCTVCNSKFRENGELVTVSLDEE